MRFMLSFRIPTEKGNQLIRDGKLGETVQSIMEDLKPEAAYFTDVDGDRGGYFIVNMDDASQLPAMAEPLSEKARRVKRECGLYSPIRCAPGGPRSLANRDRLSEKASNGSCV